MKSGGVNAVDGPSGYLPSKGGSAAEKSPAPFAVPTEDKMIRPIAIHCAKDSNSPSRKKPISAPTAGSALSRSEEHTSELQSLMRISYAVFCLKKKKKQTIQLT